MAVKGLGEAVERQAMKMRKRVVSVYREQRHD